MFRTRSIHRAIFSKMSHSCRLILLIVICCTVILTRRFPRLSEGIKASQCSKLCPYSSHFTNTTLYFSSTYSVRHFPNFVCPQNFRNLADWIYAWPDQFKENIEHTTNEGQSIAPCLPTGSIIYVRIWDIDKFFKEIYPHLINPFVLITGEGDLSSPTHLEHLHHPQSKIIHWFGQNGEIDVSSSSKFTHIPIGKSIIDEFWIDRFSLSGINCFEMADSIEMIYSKQPNHTEPSMLHEPDEPTFFIQLIDVSQRALSTTIPTKQLVLINFDPKTDKTGVRQDIWRDLCRKDNAPGGKFVECIKKPKGVQIDHLVSLYQRNRQYPFWLSPRGNGIDCHRTWEALYLDIIPIVWNSTLNILYENLPVLIINDHKELNETFLYSKLKEISTKKLTEKGAYSYEKLRNSYWRRLILRKSRYAGYGKKYERSHRCWRAKSERR